MYPRVHQLSDATVSHLVAERLGSSETAAFLRRIDFMAGMGTGAKDYKSDMSTTFANFEFHRAGIGLLPAAGQGQEGSALYVKSPTSDKPLRSCTCEESRGKVCDHLKALIQGVETFRVAFDGRSWHEVFKESVWYNLGRELFAGSAYPYSAVHLSEVEVEGRRIVRIRDPQGVELVRYLDAGPGRVRLLERIGRTSQDREGIDRAALLDRLDLFQTSAEERQLNRQGVRTNGQVWFESFWYRLAYHAFREYEDDPGGGGVGYFLPAIDRREGDFVLTFRFGAQPPGEEDHDPNAEGANPAKLKIVVPREQVPDVLTLLRQHYPEQKNLQISPVPLQSIFRVSEETEIDMPVRNVIRKLQFKGLMRYFRSTEFKHHRYGRLVYVPSLGVLSELEEAGAERKFRTPRLMRLERCLLASYEEPEIADEPVDDAAPVGGGRGSLEIFKEYDYVEVNTEAFERSWYYLSVRYGFGQQSISLEDILAARRSGLPYLETTQGWIDLNSPHFAELEDLEKAHRVTGEEAPARGLRLSASDLLRFQAAVEKPIKVRGRTNRARLVRRLLELEPSKTFDPPRGLTSTLRPYQIIGVDWLHFLFENRLAGLLCDDMGLGKTHQAMALMVALREQEGIRGKFLVVCPTSVISHWRNKIRDFAPGLHAFVYHGPERDFAEAMRVADVVVTSYGILRNDQLEFGEVTFPLAIFDEIQHIKNRDTLGYEAAQGLGAEVKFGLTGTPIENSLGDLKALFDLILPGYMGTDQHFMERYARTQHEEGVVGTRLDELRRLISPFVLRRLKQSVLDELPEKIEDTRTCDLSEDQVRLYRTAIDTRGAELVNRIKHSAEPLPYIHIFALLNYLKQICDHPALALKTPDDVGKYRSGKWDLFVEILGECLDAGLKVVVFTQYLGMIALMEHHLRKLKVDYVKLTGASVDRGEIIDRFNEVEDCRVFLGSLKAGGTGIDLVGGSVVIHYDRWWNAAREDQATDRVHRIGQKRAVQVFKLVTEGTLEEKIAAIIERKRELMDSVVQEDDPHLAKIFSREELLGLLEQI